LCQGHCKKIDVFKILTAACLNPISHYGLGCGQLRPGDPADFILLKDLVHFEVVQTWLKGRMVAKNGNTLLGVVEHPACPNQFHARQTVPADFSFRAFPSKESIYPYPVIEAFDGQLITGKYSFEIKPENGNWNSNTEKDILKIIVLNRYSKAPIAKAFIKNFGLKSGALASSVAHDSHNIVAIGTNDEDLCKAVNAVIAEKGGISIYDGAEVLCLALPIAGLMSKDEGYRVAEMYTRLDAKAKNLGSGLQSPFMTLSFMALLVIPHLKLSDLGLFDGDLFHIV